MLGLAALFASAAAGHAEAGAPESALKATYLYKFAPFVAWPASAFSSPSSPFHLCVLGDDPFSVILEQAVRGQYVDEHPMMVRRIRTVESTGCHILYLGEGAGRPVADALRNLRGAPILTVCDQTLGVRGAIIQFVVRNGRVRFDIDADAAAASGVTISSKLLSLATSARPEG